MKTLSFALRLLTALASLSVVRSLDSINLDLEMLDEIDLSALGTPNLDRHQLSFNLTVDDNCQYLLKVDFIKHPDDNPGDASPAFTGVCDPGNDTGTVAPDGKEWHEHRRNWMQLPKYVYETTGFDHISLFWRPCGLPPLSRRQPRYDLVFYTVIPQYRAFWVCDEFDIPRVCQYNQSTPLGRGHFSIPRLDRDPNFLANLPNRFQPDPVEPQALQYEGLITFDADLVPEDPLSWILPALEMSTYDGDVVSYRALLPYRWISEESTDAFQTQTYVFQTKPRLPVGFNMTYSKNSGVISLVVYGSAGLCGEEFDDAQVEEEESIMEDDLQLRYLRE